jgi:geranylgeranyl reductase family protein
MRVALLEKRRIPRHKTCGGGMPMSVGEVLRDLVPEAVVESDVRFMRHTWKFGDPVLGEINPPGETHQISLWMVQRSLFDEALARRAVAAGAELLDGVAARSIEVSDKSVSIAAESEGGAGLKLSARYIIGADGANGITSKSVGLRRNRPLAIGLEVEHPHTWGHGHQDLRPDVLHLEYGAVRHGYAWIFPKGEHLNVGAGLFRQRGVDGRGDAGVRPLLQQAVFHYLDSMGVRYDPNAMQFHGHPLPIWNGREPLHAANGRIMLAGDAAGLINPLFGDGILHAIKSGVIAAQCAATDSGDRYTERIYAELGTNFDAALKLAKFFYQWTGTVYRHAIKRPTATRSAARLLSGDAVFTDVAGRAMRRLRGKLIRS